MPISNQFIYNKIRAGMAAESRTRIGYNIGYNLSCPLSLRKQKRRQQRYQLMHGDDFEISPLPKKNQARMIQIM
jgi:hypothetical protein